MILCRPERKKEQHSASMHNRNERQMTTIAQNLKTNLLRESLTRKKKHHISASLSLSVLSQKGLHIIFLALSPLPSIVSQREITMDDS
uniref:Uncharacterized protein n=1 Tax=Anguilla anguilla TaxID=7936 RepID=A0A0E9SLF9_ANGAN